MLAHDKESLVGHEEKRRPARNAKERGESNIFIPPGKGGDRTLELLVVNISLFRIL